jgi:hypothetical protein
MQFGKIGPRFVAVLLLSFAGGSAALAQQYDKKLFEEMRWRCIGPFRGGRTVAISGVPHQPNVFLHGGGEWRRLENDRFWKYLESDL